MAEKAKGKRLLEKGVKLESDMRFVCLDPNHRIRMVIKDPVQPALELDFVNITIRSRFLPEDFDPNVYDVTGEISVSLKVKERG